MRLPKMGFLTRMDLLTNRKQQTYRILSDLEFKIVSLVFCSGLGRCYLVHTLRHLKTRYRRLYTDVETTFSLFTPKRKYFPTKCGKKPNLATWKGIENATAKIRD